MGDERGDVILEGLVKLVLTLGVIALLIFEAGAIGMNRLQLDETGQRAARAGAMVLAERARPAAIESAIHDALVGKREVQLVSWGIQGDEVVVTLQRPASTLVLDRIGPLSGWASASVTKSAAVRR